MRPSTGFLIFYGIVIVDLSFGKLYSDKWAVHIVGGEEVAIALCKKYGFRYLGPIMTDIYHFQHRKVAKRSTRPNRSKETELAKETSVLWLKQQEIKSRVKRDTLANLNDPKWPSMWYLNRGGGLDMNVEAVWEMGITGKEVVVTILDDGLEKEHPDIKINYDSKASSDINGRDPDPSPRYDDANTNRHGTRCAGEVAAQANNSNCVVGVAFNARIGGVRMLDGEVTDAVEAQSLSLNPQYIDIYSASWGPDDDGQTVDGPAELARKAFLNGITKGRGGLGSIFVWASGNGGRDYDSCNCDGYTNSIYTLSISSATEHGGIPWYSEACSSTLATTYSSGTLSERQIVTTDLHFGCTSGHTGTSASAPLAAGICALALEANPGLTWRDMQHIVIRTARPENLFAPDWKTNGVGRNVSHSFGYGLMDAAAMVKLAKNWTTVPTQRVCEIKATETRKIVPNSGILSLNLFTNACKNTANYISYLEHVQAKVSLMAQRRGDIQIHLTSPLGTRATLLALRPKDSSFRGFESWPFMSVHTWGERPEGQWKLEIENTGTYTATMKDWGLILYGTDSKNDNINCARTNSAGVCLECNNKMYMVDHFCMKECPSTYYPSKKRIYFNGKQKDVKTCNSCSWGCEDCKTEYYCNKCLEGYKLVNSVCILYKVETTVSLNTTWFIVITVGFCVLAILIFFILFAFLQLRDRQSWTCCRDEIVYSGIVNPVDNNENNIPIVNESDSDFDI